MKSYECDDYINSNETNQIGVSPTGKFAALGSKNGQLIILNLNDGEIEEIFDREHTTSIVACDWSRRYGSKVATVDSMGYLFIWD